MINRPPRYLFVAFAFLLSAFCSLPGVRGQSSSATLSGTIEDQNSAVVPGAAIVVLNTATSFKRQATTNDDGSFTIPLLPPGTYSVTVRRDGFTPLEIREVVLNVGDQKALQIQLKAGDVNAAVTVDSNAEAIKTDASVGTVIDRQFVQNLPLNGRSFQSLILLSPGVTVTNASYANDLGQFSVNGQRASANLFTVDGVSANIGISVITGSSTNMALAGAYPGLSAFGGTNNLVSIDSLQEFKIQTSSYSAEFGRQPGGQISLVTRSGANQFHGTAFEYFRNEALDARNYFNKVPNPKPALRQNQFGATSSGPVLLPRFGEGGRQPGYNGRNRTFFFFSYEGQRLRLPISGIVFVPSLRLRQAAAPALIPLLRAFPLPTGAELLNGAGQPLGWAPFNFGVSNPSTLDATSIRIDHTFSGKLTLFGRFNESPSSATGGDFAKFATISSTRTMTLGATSVLSARLTNEVRFNYSRQNAKQQGWLAGIGGAIPIEDPAALTSWQGGIGFAGFRFGGFSNGLNVGTFSANSQQQVNLVDNFAFLKGAHQFKSGIDYRRLAPSYGPQDQQSINFLSEADVVGGTISMLRLVTIQRVRPRFENFSAYFQDTWKVSPRLTVDLGLRWELSPPPHEADGIVPPLVTGITGTDLSKATLEPPGTSTPFYRTSYTAFAPRFGVGYQLNRASGRETVLRGGFGVYYDLGSGTAAIGYPISVGISRFVVPFPVPSALANHPGIQPVTLPTTRTLRSLDQDLKLPYTLQWNVALEQSLGTRQTFSLSYVAAVARRLLTTEYLNQPTGNVRPNPNFALIIWSGNGSTADYHSFQAQYKARLKGGLQALVNYTWSHAIDEVSSDIQSFVLSRGNADFDIRHNLSAAISYNLPTGQARPVLNQLFRNWSVDGIVHLQSGRPVDVTTGDSIVIDGRYLDVRPDLIQGMPLYINDATVPGGRRFNSAAFRSPPANPADPTVPARQGNFGRNVLRGGALYQMDIGLRRRFRLTEQWKLELKAEGFNVFNHPMFGNYGTNFLSPSTFGVPNQSLGSNLGGGGAGLNALYQIGGPRSMQLSVRLLF